MRVYKISDLQVTQVTALIVCWNPLSLITLVLSPMDMYLDLVSPTVVMTHVTKRRWPNTSKAQALAKSYLKVCFYIRSLSLLFFRTWKENWFWLVMVDIHHQGSCLEMRKKIMKILMTFVRERRVNVMQITVSVALST